MSWLLVAISSYFLFALVYLVDKFLLTGPLPSPKLYAFYIGLLRGLVVLLIPFVPFAFPGAWQIFLSFLAGFFFLLGVWWFFKGLQLFETSRVAPAVGGATPIFSFALIYIFSGGKETLNSLFFLSLVFLISGIFLITYERSKRLSLKSLAFSCVAAFFLAASFVFSRYVYEGQSFLQGLIWINIGGALSALFFFFFKEVRQNFLKRTIKGSRGTVAIFLANQVMGAGAAVLQQLALALAPAAAYVAVVNALQGVQYVFLLFFTLIFSLFLPKFIKEDLSGRVIVQKGIAITLIIAGLILITFLK